MQTSMFIRIILTLFLTSFFSSCVSSSGGPAELLLTEKDNGKTIEININTKIIINLKSNPSTGYRWENINPDNSNINQGGESVFLLDDKCSGLDGCGGKEQFIFKACKTGNGGISLVYHRSFKEAPIDEFRVDINVR